VALTVIALLTSAAAAYYYLNVVAQMYFKDPHEGEPSPVGAGTKILVAACSAALIAGVAFGPWMMDWVGKIALG